ncbi:MAG TPA: acyltransferase [Puia sp.]|nr:acyltransferase [Puia sp.]
MKLNSIQMLRAVAALLVVYTHSISQMGIFALGWQQRTPARISLGTFGVDLFFVISGFIIYLSAGQLSGRWDSLSFLWHRFRRINPAYYAAVALTVITWIPSFVRHQRPPITGWQILSWSILLPLPGLGHGFAADPPRALSQAWSLSFEWLFYLLFFGLIFFRTRRKALILCLSLGGLALLGWLLQDEIKGVLLFYTDPLLLEFGMGIILGVVWKRWTPRKPTALCLLLPGLLVGVALMLTGYVDYQAVLLPSASIRYLHALLWGGAATFVVAGCVFLEKNGTRSLLFHNPLILLLGNASYSIYLFHMIVFGWIAAIYLHFGFFLNADAAIPLHAAIAVAASLLFYKWVEKPLLIWLRKSRTPIPPRTAKP